MLARATSSTDRVGDSLAKRTMVGLSVAVVTLGASLVPSAVQAGADQMGSTRAQLQSLQQQVVASAGRVRAMTLAYEQADAKASALAQQVEADQANLARLRNTMASTAAQLRTDAILSYTGGAGNAGSLRSTGGDTLTSSGAPSDPAIREEYLQVAAGDLSDRVDQYRTQAGQVAAAAASLAAELRASRAAVEATAAAREAAIGAAGQVEAQLVSVQNRLQQLEASQAAAQARAAATAAQAAAAAAARSATQGLPVNGGLVTAVRGVVSPTGGNSGGEWLQLRECESGDNYQANTGNGFYGAYQFSESTWTGLGYPGRPDLEPPSMQDQAAQRLQARSGWGQWPACSAALGLS